MKKLLKLLFISTMAIIPLSSSVVLAACSFSMGDTEIAIAGVTNNSIYIDALKDPNKVGDTNSPRSNNKIIDIKIKNPQKGYVIRWNIVGNNVQIQGPERVEDAKLIGVESIKNEPGSSNVSLRVFSNTYISKDIESANINFEYWNESTKTSIIPDIKNKTINVQVHMVEVEKVLHPFDISNLPIPKENAYNFKSPNSRVNKDTFLDQYIINIIDRKITTDGINLFGFELGVHYNIFMNGVNVESNNSAISNMIEEFYNFGELNEIKVEIKSTNKSTDENWTVAGQFDYSIKYIQDGHPAPTEPGGTIPEDGKDEIFDLEKLSINNYEYNFKDMDENYKKEFATNYVEQFIKKIVDEFSSSDLKINEHYTVKLDNGQSYTKNYWEDPEQQTATEPFFKWEEEPTGDDEVINFKVESVKNSRNKIIATGEKSFSFTHNKTSDIAPRFPGKDVQSKWINIPFNFMFEGANIDLSKMGGKNKDSALLKEGLGGLILDIPIILASNADIKSSITKGFDVFHGEITKEDTIRDFVLNKPIGNDEFDSEPELREKFAEIIKDKNNWTMNWWQHNGLVGPIAIKKPELEIPEVFHKNHMSTISYALTVSAKKKLEALRILPRTDSFQFPMWVEVVANQTEKFDDYFGSKGFRTHYLDEYMGLIVGNSTDFVSSEPGSYEEIEDPDKKFEIATYENILTQQALGTINKNGVPNTDPTQYLTSGADFAMSNRDENKHFRFTLQESDKFDEKPETKYVDGIRAIYANDILKKVTEIWARTKLSNTSGGKIPAELSAKFQQKQVRVNYGNDGNGNPVDGWDTKPSEIADKLVAEKLPENSDKVQLIDNAYFLDLTSENGYKTDGGGGIQITFANEAFNRVLLNGESAPSSVEAWDFLDGGKVGTSKLKEENWLKYNVYNATNKIMGGRASLTIPQFTPEKIEIIDQSNTNDNAIYLYAKTTNIYGNASEMYDKSIKHVIIKINKS